MVSVFDGVKDEFGSAADELERLGLKFLGLVFRHCSRVENKELDFKTHEVFHEHRGIEMFLASAYGKLAVYSVEQDHGDLKVTIMFAGEHGTKQTYEKCRWDGVSYDDCRSSMIEPRAKFWFI